MSEAKGGRERPERSEDLRSRGRRPRKNNFGHELTLVAFSQAPQTRGADGPVKRAGAEALLPGKQGGRPDSGRLA